MNIRKALAWLVNKTEVVLTVDVFVTEIDDAFTKIKFYLNILKQYSENESYDKRSEEHFLI